jgi:hypothetical protein
MADTNLYDALSVHYCRMLNDALSEEYKRCGVGPQLPMPGVLALLENVAKGQVIDDILLMAQCHAPDEIKDQVLYIPL